MQRFNRLVELARREFWNMPELSRAEGVYDPRNPFSAARNVVYNEPLDNINAVFKEMAESDRKIKHRDYSIPDTAVELLREIVLHEVAEDLGDEPEVEAESARCAELIPDS